MTRCAIYTRKSSDEGLDQQFNSLDAQREACEAYALSQAGEGWITLPARYDDGGFSGGSMERPALRRLLDAIRKGEVDVVVVYKIDRLTRSLADFARIVEQFDAKGVSFVSVTQAFNTTSSMGRLTLNVLLSFAQFEREVTGERIRDKIAASKAKGMWMGGLPPLGYDRPEGRDRVLRINHTEASTVRLIFERYLELGSVHALVADLANQGIVSKQRLARDGRSVGGAPFTRGALFHLLRNPIYLGKIVHKTELFEGLHEAIVTTDLFDQVQARLGAVTKAKRLATAARAPLTGKIFLVDGTRLTPTHSRGARGRSYHYYAPLADQQGRTRSGRRLPAAKLESLLRVLLAPLGGKDGEDPLIHIARIDVGDASLDLSLLAKHWPVVQRIAGGEHMVSKDDHHLHWIIPYAWSRGATCIAATTALPRRDAVLIRALRVAHAMLDHDHRGRPLMREVPRPRYERRIARLAFLSPTLQRDIIEGRQPPQLTLERIVRSELPLDWDEQMRWASATS